MFAYNIGVGGEQAACNCPDEDAYQFFRLGGFLDIKALGFPEIETIECKNWCLFEDPTAEPDGDSVVFAVPRVLTDDERKKLADYVWELYGRRLDKTPYCARYISVEQWK